MARKTPTKDIKILWGRAAARCSRPDCRKVCVVEAKTGDPAVVTGKIAHIVAHSDRGPRPDQAMSESDRDRYDNWILLCGDHHDEVDGQPNTHSVDVLRQWKNDHEQWVREQLSQAMPEVTSAELEIVCRAIVAAPSAPTTDFTVTAPAEKMQRNGLTNRVAYTLKLGMAASNEVAEFLQDIAALDPNFPERLKAGFVKLHHDLKESGLEGDDLFEEMASVARRGLADFKTQAAALAVLAHLFEACEVFDR